MTRRNWTEEEYRNWASRFEAQLRSLHPSTFRSAGPWIYESPEVMDLIDELLLNTPRPEEVEDIMRRIGDDIKRNRD